MPLLYLHAIQSHSQHWFVYPFFQDHEFQIVSFCFVLKCYVIIRKPLPKTRVLFTKVLVYADFELMHWWGSSNLKTQLGALSCNCLIKIPAMTDNYIHLPALKRDATKNNKGKCALPFLFRSLVLVKKRVNKLFAWWERKYGRDFGGFAAIFGFLLLGSFFYWLPWL